MSGLLDQRAGMVGWKARTNTLFSRCVSVCVVAWCLGWGGRGGELKIDGPPFPARRGHWGVGPRRSLMPALAALAGNKTDLETLGVAVDVGDTKFVATSGNQFQWVDAWCNNKYLLHTAGFSYSAGGEPAGVSLVVEGAVRRGVHSPPRHSAVSHVTPCILHRASEPGPCRAPSSSLLILSYPESQAPTHHPPFPPVPALKYRLACESLVFKVQSKWVEFYEPGLLPGVHYVALPPYEHEGGDAEKYIKEMGEGPDAGDRNEEGGKRRRGQCDQLMVSGPGLSMQGLIQKLQALNCTVQGMTKLQPWALQDIE